MFQKIHIQAVVSMSTVLNMGTHPSEKKKGENCFADTGSAQRKICLCFCTPANDGAVIHINKKYLFK
jgi:hypothetical protein